jgi:hypothetical protein
MIELLVLPGSRVEFRLTFVDFSCRAYEYVNV